MKIARFVVDEGFNKVHVSLIGICAAEAEQAPWKRGTRVFSRSILCGVNGWMAGWLAGWMDGVGGSFVKDSAGPFFSLSLSLSPDFSSLSLCN